MHGGPRGFVRTRAGNGVTSQDGEGGAPAIQEGTQRRQRGGRLRSLRFSRRPPRTARLGAKTSHSPLENVGPAHETVSLSGTCLVNALFPRPVREVPRITLRNPAPFPGSPAPSQHICCLLGGQGRPRGQGTGRHVVSDLETRPLRAGPRGTNTLPLSQRALTVWVSALRHAWGFESRSKLGPGRLKGRFQGFRTQISQDVGAGGRHLSLACDWGAGDSPRVPLGL